jgi:hypothetical protein
MLMRRVGTVVILRENTEDPTEEDWTGFLKFLSNHSAELPRMKMLVRTDGGTANASQRKRLKATLGEANPLVAVVSDAMKVRFAGSTIALFQKNYRQFTTEELPLAYAHLKLTAQEQQDAARALVELEAELKIRPY